MKNAKSQAVACSHDSINHHDVVLDLNSSKACGAPISNLSQESCSSNSKNVSTNQSTNSFSFLIPSFRLRNSS
ncbi:hypothetical protein Lalb_Chr07g0187661 [Lupinus albus]|uniref:Uncharacterized protein n=1 Tax=Lupinus albus TaxID=3870 RepID=A0A6A4Q9D5_LUPAL|nr:hypothetical protein Lalb_Chr07g0187661 [Lupinus albus]